MYIEATLSLEKQMQKFCTLMLAFGYRAPVREDLVAGKELYMIEVERFMQIHNQNMNPSLVATLIKLDENPIKPSKTELDGEMVYYHCIMPAWKNQCFVSVDDFTATGYREGLYVNDTRYLVRSR